MTGAPDSQTPLTATFNGRTITAESGQTVGAALMNNGFQAWRDTRFNYRSRGLFCGIGVCFDCLVTIDGHPNQRACLAPLREGMTIEGSTK